MMDTDTNSDIDLDMTDIDSDMTDNDSRQSHMGHTDLFILDI